MPRAQTWRQHLRQLLLRPGFRAAYSNALARTYLPPLKANAAYEAQYRARWLNPAATIDHASYALACRALRLLQVTDPCTVPCCYCGGTGIRYARTAHTLDNVIGHGSPRVFARILQRWIHPECWLTYKAKHHLPPDLHHDAAPYDPSQRRIDGYAAAPPPYTNIRNTRPRRRRPPDGA